MSVESHLAQLQRKHQALEQAIAAEMAHPHHDETKIATMKRKKLLLKDEITKLKPLPKANGLH